MLSFSACANGSKRQAVQRLLLLDQPQLILAPRASPGTKAALTRSYLEKVEFDLLLRVYGENVKEFLLCVYSFGLPFLSDLHTC